MKLVNLLRNVVEASSDDSGWAHPMIIMTNKMKKIFILTPLIIILCLFGVYFLFPGVMFDLLKTAERSAAGLKQHSIYVKGLRIEYLEGGKGDALVLLHGFGANKDNWTRFGKHLTSHFRVIAPDLTGFGESSPDPGGDYTIRVQRTRNSSPMTPG